MESRSRASLLTLLQVEADHVGESIMRRVNVRYDYVVLQ